MNNLKKKKKGFTLVELMAVIAIIAILAAVLVPTVNGYITRSKKTAVITQVRNIVNAIESYNITASTPISDEYDLNKTDNKKIMVILKNADLVDNENTPSAPKEDLTYKILKEINNATDALDKIAIQSNVISGWNGDTKYGTYKK